MSMEERDIHTGCTGKFQALNNSPMLKLGQGYWYLGKDHLTTF